MQWFTRLLVAAGILALLFPSPSVAQTSRGGFGTAFTYQGELTVDDMPWTGTADLRFTLYDAALGGTPASITLVLAQASLTDGRTVADLDFGAIAFDGTPRWLELQVRTPAWDGIGQEPAYTTLTPRQPLLPTPYAMRASQATSVLWSGIQSIPSGLADGTDDGVFSLSGADAYFLSGDVAIGHSDPDALFDVGVAAAPHFQVVPDTTNGHIRIGSLTGTGGAVSLTSRGNTEIVIDNNDNSNSNSFSVRKDGHEGDANSSVVLEVREGGLTVFGNSTDSDGGLLVHAGDRSTAITVNSDSVGGQGIDVDMSDLNGLHEAGRFTTASTLGTGVHGRATANSGVSYGVHGRSDSATGYGVYGEASRNTGRNYGVYGHTDSTDLLAYGVFAGGNLGASGFKTFLIDHPVHPATQFLVHYSTEGPEPQNVYNGTATLDQIGEAWVELPDYFEAANTDPRYQLTAIGAPAPLLHVAERAVNNRFRIAGGSPGMDVCWEVTARRHDPFAANVDVRAVRMKQADEVGLYIQPELYGQPPSQALHRRRTVTPATGPSGSSIESEGAGS